MRRVARHLIEFRAFEETYRHAQTAALFNESLQADVVALLRHADPLERPPRAFSASVTELMP